MEKKKKLSAFYTASFLALVGNMVGDLVKLSLVGWSWRFESWYGFFQGRCETPRFFLPSCILWLEWFLWDVLGSCFHSTRSLGLTLVPFLTQGCFGLWRGLFACVGNRGLVGWRRVALKGFFTKLRFVTRYNYRKRGHYFWRRNQRRWRLFKTRRRLRFFIRRYRKFRRLRYFMSFQFAWRAQQRLEVLGLRWGGSAISLFSFGFLRWRAYLLAQRRPSVASSRVFFWRRQASFRFFRYRRGFSRFRYQAVVTQVSPRRKRFWYNRKTRAVAVRRYVARNFLGWRHGKRMVRRRRRRRLPSSAFILLSRTLKKSRRRYSLLAARPIVRPKGRVRWRLLKRRRKRAKRIRRVVRDLPGLRYYIRVRWGTRTLRRKFRRRIKRRVKRRRKYAPRWTRTFLVSRRRRRVLRARFIRRLRRKGRVVRHPLRIRARRMRFPVVYRARRLTARLPLGVLTVPLTQVAGLQSLWGVSGVRARRLRIGKLQLVQRRLRARHLAWDDDDVPNYQRVLYFRRWRTQKPFGRRRRWVASLFINATRHFYYRERKFPMVKSLNTPSNTLVGPHRGMFLVGARLRSAEVAVFRRRFWQRARFTFGRRRAVRLRRRLARKRLVDVQQVRECRRVRQRVWFKRFRVGKRMGAKRLLFRLRFGLFARFRRRVILRRSYVRTTFSTSFWFRTVLWRLRVLRLRFRLRKSVHTRRRVVERFLFRSFRRRFIFRLKFLQPGTARVVVRKFQCRSVQLYRRGFSRQLRLAVRLGRLRRFIFQVRRKFRLSFIKRLREQVRSLAAGGDELPLWRLPTYSRLAFFNGLTRKRALALNRKPAVLGIPRPGFGLMRKRPRMYRLSRYIAKRGAGLFKAHALLTRRYPSVYDFETFNYLFSSSFLYNRFTQKGNRLRSQIIVMSVLRYLRPYSSFHLVRFIERFLVEGFPIYFEMSSLKQSNKEQPFPVPINLVFFRTYMLKAIATRFRARRHAVSFQAALLTELWSWHVDPTASILHDFLMNHYAVGMDSRFFVHYRWKVKR